MDEQKLIRKNIVITGVQDEMIKKIIEKKGWKTKSFSRVLDLAVDELYNSIFKDYVVNRATTSAKTPEQRVAEQEERGEIKRKNEEEKLLKIAEALEGRVSIGAGGGKVVVYYTYDRKNRYQQQLPLSMMTEELIGKQYFPSKEDVVARQEKGEVNYDPKTWE